jgi:6-hydroxycyclohex-1-ene-1-carbonyl-CoA dehydrogenase
MSIEASGWFFTQVGKPLEKRAFTIAAPQGADAVIEIAGCGLCHTDLTFFEGVQTKKGAPLILGHEVSGKVIAAGPASQHLVGKNVIVPAVLPCGECELCRAGRENICQHQKMPGNDFDGGFASHIIVPGRFLCVLPADLGRHKVSDLSVVADAITTPYQSLKRSGLKAGELAIVVGVGGVGIYMVQHAKNVGATVIALDVDEGRLELAKAQGARFTLNTKGLDQKELKQKLRALVKDNKLPAYQWRVFEMSGTKGGQETAYNLLSYAGTLAIVGFTMDKLDLRLSNLMAFDAECFGNWGCRPQYYDDVVKDVIANRVELLANVEYRPLATVNEVFAAAQSHSLKKRVIFTP